MKEGCYMASLDLLDAYFSVAISHEYRKYFKFIWKETKYQFNSMPNGLSCACRVFTRLLKPVFAKLQKSGHVSSGFLDESFLVGDSFHICKNNIEATFTELTNLGFFPHEEKSILQPTQIIQHLGFELNSIDMTISITNEKHANSVEVEHSISKQDSPVIRDVMRVVGMMVVNIPGVRYGKLFYKQLEIDKIRALKLNKGNFDRRMQLSDTAKSDINWWVKTLNLVL